MIDISLLRERISVMRKKLSILFLIPFSIVTIFLVYFIYDIYQFNKHQQQVDASYELLTKHPSLQLQSNLHQNHIPFVINEENHLFIPKKYTQQAIICCS